MNTTHRLNATNFFTKPTFEEVFGTLPKPAPQNTRPAFSDEEVKATAKEITQNLVRSKTTAESKKEAQTLAAIFEGVIVPLFNTVQQNLNAMEISDLEAIGQLPSGVWDKMNTRQRKSFIEEIYATVRASNKSQDQIGKLIGEYQETLDMLTPETQDTLMKLQDKLLKVIYPPARKPRQPKQQSLKPAA